MVALERVNDSDKSARIDLNPEEINANYDYLGSLAIANYKIVLNILADPELFPNEDVNVLMQDAKKLIYTSKGVNADLEVNSKADNLYYLPVSVNQTDSPPLDTLFIPQNLYHLSDNQMPRVWHNDSTHRLWLNDEVREVVKGTALWLSRGKPLKKHVKLIESFDRTLMQGKVDLLAVWQDKLSERVHQPETAGGVY